MRRVADMSIPAILCVSGAALVIAAIGLKKLDDWLANRRSVYRRLGLPRVWP
jgi:hypothetical protein